MTVAPVKATSKCCQFQFETVAAVVSVAIAVVGIVACIFTGQIWGAVGFALLGVNAIFMGIKGAANSVEFKKETQKLETIDTGLKSQIISLQQTCDGLKQSVKGLQSENDQLKAAEKQWLLEENKLKSENQMLSATKTKLNGDLSTFTKSCKKMQDQIGQLLAQTIDMGKASGAFQAEEGKLSATEEKLKGTVASLQEFQGDFDKFSEHIETGKAASQEIFKHLSEVQQKQQSELSELKAVNANFQANASSLEAEMGKLTAQWDAIKAKSTELDSLSKQLLKNKVALGKEEERIKQESQKLSEQEAKIQDLLKKLNEGPQDDEIKKQREADNKLLQDKITANLNKLQALVKEREKAQEDIAELKKQIEVLRLEKKKT